MPEAEVMVYRFLRRAGASLFSFLATASLTHAQTDRGRIGVELNGGVYVAATSFGTHGVVRAKEGSAKAIGGAVTYRFGQNRSVGIGLAVNWVWDLSTHEVPTPACTGRCGPSTAQGGRSLLALASVTWQASGRLGAFSVTGGPGLKSYLNGGSINVCEGEPFCRDRGYFSESLTDLAGQLSVGWRPSTSSRLGLRVSDVMSRYKTGRMQHDLLFLLTLHVL